MLMFFENFTEESKSNKPCKWVITKHFRINEVLIVCYAAVYSELNSTTVCK